MDDVSDEQAIANIRGTLDRTVAKLSAAHARDEALAEYIQPHRILVFTRGAVMKPVGRVWRLGVLLLAANGTLYATGSATRAVEPGRPGYQSQSTEERRAYRAAAFNGPFVRGETVNFDASVIRLDADYLRSSAGPLLLDGSRPMVRWNWGAAGTTADTRATALNDYLTDRAALLIHPPDGA